ncbi:MAG: lysophospholipid acyltransferase family protein [Dehalococcoidia bacterium]|nr:lysophospholipid acyltransferase family protein [Dehalococcoidia bacterium]
MINRLWWMRATHPLASRYPGAFYRVASAAAAVAWVVRRDLRRNLVRNMLPLCDGDLAQAKRASKQAMKHAAQYYVDLASLSRRDISRFEESHLEIFHAERLEILAAQGPLVIVSAHTGNAELAIQVLTYRGRPFVALVEALEPRELAEYMLSLRSSAGGTFHEATFGGVRAMMAALKNGQIAGVMGDRDIQDTGVCVTFCGRHVKVPRGPWELARRFDAPVLPVFSARKHGDQFRIDVGEVFRVARTGDLECDIRRAAERYVRLLEAQLRRDPGQWTVLEDFWKVHGCGNR